MADGGDTIAVRTVERIADVPAAAWDACASADNPFLSHAFLSALEESGSAVVSTGWAPRHLVAEDAAGQVVAVAPMYLKSHSYGEYVFDHGWAEAYESAGGRYYPKMLVGVPFTPVPGARLLTRPGDDAPAIRSAAAAALIEIGRRNKLSSAHITFCSEEEARALAEDGWLIREGTQYHWANAGYKTFDDYLAAFSHSRRKGVRKERREVADQGIVVEALNGADIKSSHWDKFYEFYMATGDRKWGQAYLTRAFFHRLGETMAARVVLMMARRDDEYIAGALNLMGSEALYGRNWGSYGEFPFLHFEACYYKAIEFAIQRGLARVEAGAQGKHKIQRGYLPVATYSAHWIRDDSFRKAVSDFLRRETSAMRAERRALAEYSPFKQTESGS